MFEMSHPEKATTSKTIDVENDSLPEAINKEKSNSSISNQTRDKLKQIIQRRLLRPELRDEVREAGQVLDKTSSPEVKAEITEMLHPLRVTVGEEAPTTFDKDNYVGNSLYDKFSQFMASPEGGRYKKEVTFGISTLRRWTKKWDREEQLDSATRYDRKNAITHINKGLLGKLRSEDESLLSAFISVGKINFFKSVSALYEKELPSDMVHPLINLTLSELNVCDPGIFNGLQKIADDIDIKREGGDIFEQAVKQHEVTLTMQAAAHVKKLHNNGTLTLTALEYLGFETHLVAAHRWAIVQKIGLKIWSPNSLKELSDPYSQKIIANKFPWVSHISFAKSVEMLIKKIEPAITEVWRDWLNQQAKNAYTLISKALDEVGTKPDSNLLQQNIPSEKLKDFTEAFEDACKKLQAQGWDSKNMPNPHDIFVADEEYLNYSMQLRIETLFANLCQQSLENKTAPKRHSGPPKFVRFKTSDEWICLFYHNEKYDVMRPEHLNEFFDEVWVIEYDGVPDFSDKIQLIEAAERWRDPSDEEHDKMFARWRASLNQPSTSRE